MDRRVRKLTDRAKAINPNLPQDVLAGQLQEIARTSPAVM
jgi:hypothetical protein